jgi:hypothetical protein
VRGIGEQHPEIVEFGAQADDLVGEVGAELDQHVAIGHELAGRDGAHPVVRQIGPGQDQAAGLEVADIVADHHLARAFLDQVKLILGMVVPLGEMVRVVVHVPTK